MNNNEEYTPYEIPTDEVKNDGIIGQSPISDIIRETGNLNPTRFWMTVMVIIMLAIGVGMTMWVNKLYEEIGRKDLRITELEKAVQEAPQKAIDQLRETHKTIQELRGEIKSTGEKVEKSNTELLKTNDKLKEIEKGL